MQNTTPNNLVHLLQGMMASKHDQLVKKDNYYFMSAKNIDECLSQFNHYYHNILHFNDSTLIKAHLAINRVLNVGENSSSFFQRKLNQLYLNKKKSMEDVMSEVEAEGIEDLDTLFLSLESRSSANRA